MNVSKANSSMHVLKSVRGCPIIPFVDVSSVDPPVEHLQVQLKFTSVLLFMHKISVTGSRCHNTHYPRNIKVSPSRFMIVLTINTGIVRNTALEPGFEAPARVAVSFLRSAVVVTADEELPAVERVRVDAGAVGTAEHCVQHRLHPLSMQHIA